MATGFSAKITTIISFIEKKWIFFSILGGIVSIFLSGWVASGYFMVGPRDFIIEQQRIKIADLNEEIRNQELDIEKLERKIDPNNRSYSVPNYSIKIIYPKNGDKVSDSTIVRGTVLGELPQGQHMWVIINPHTFPRLWWPQSKRIEPMNEQWSVEALVSDPSLIHMNKEFDIAIVLVNKTDDQHYSDYIKKGVETGLLLPDSYNIIDAVTVTNDGFL